jgi:hypothetical protein
MKFVGHIARVEEMKNARKILVGKPERKRPLGRPRRRWEYMARIYIREMGWDDVDWIHQAQDSSQ